ncbi:hypothetical protein PS1_042334 [Malus domestica]
MFPHGADAYIDDIGKLINLKDGSIRTAIDTGCGVASWGAYLLSATSSPCRSRQGTRTCRKSNLLWS